MTPNTFCTHCEFAVFNLISKHEIQTQKLKNPTKNYKNSSSNNYLKTPKINMSQNVATNY